MDYNDYVIWFQGLQELILASKQKTLPLKHLPTIVRRELKPKVKYTNAASKDPSVWLCYQSGLENARKQLDGLRERMATAKLVNTASTEAINKKIQELTMKLYQGFERVKNKYYT